MSNTPLQKELGIYERNLNTWLAEGHQGKFVLIKDENIIGFYPTYEEALAVGYTKHSPPPFLVKQISAIQAVMFVTRRVVPHAPPDISDSRA